MSVRALLTGTAAIFERARETVSSPEGDRERESAGKRYDPEGEALWTRRRLSSRECAFPINLRCIRCVAGASEQGVFFPRGQ